MLSGRSEAPLDRKCFPLLTGIADACSAPLGFTLWIKEALMPERETIERAREDAREGKHGAASPKQAIAIGLSKARRAGVKLQPPRRSQTSASTSEKAERDYRKGQSNSRRRPSARRSRATSNALKKRVRSAASHASLSKQARTKQARTAARNRGSSSRKNAARKASRTRKHARA